MPERAAGDDDLDFIIAFRRGDPQALAQFTARHRSLFESIVRSLYKNHRGADEALQDLLNADLGLLFAGYREGTNFATFALVKIRDTFLFERLKSRMATDPIKYFHDFEALCGTQLKSTARRLSSDTLSPEDIVSGIEVKLFDHDCRQMRKWAAEADGVGYIIDKINWLALDEIKKHRRGRFDGPRLVDIPLPEGDVARPDEDPNANLLIREAFDVETNTALDVDRFLKQLRLIAAPWPAQEQVYLGYVLDLEYTPKEIARAMRLPDDQAARLRRLVMAKVEKTCRTDPILTSIELSFSRRKR